MEDEGKVEVPRHLQDANRDAKILGHGEGYVYRREVESHQIGQQYLQTALLGNYFYKPSDEGYEAAVKERLARWRETQVKALNIQSTTELPDLLMEDIVAIKRKMAK